jgi:F0F1-type ATP synthase delta subunit
MKVSTSTKAALRVVFMGLLCTSAVAYGQDAYPSKPIKIVLPFPPGGASTDGLARAFAQKLTKEIKINIFVENKPGAGMAVGALSVKGAPADGYTMFFQSDGRLIGQNQALRHKLAEMLVGLELAPSMTMGAAVCADRPVDGEARADLHRAKIVVGRYARSLCQMAIQLHGGIGMTQEYAVGQHLRRVDVLDQLFGDSEMHSETLAQAFDSAQYSQSLGAVLP